MPLRSNRSRKKGYSHTAGPMVIRFRLTPCQWSEVTVVFQETNPDMIKFIRNIRNIPNLEKHVMSLDNELNELAAVVRSVVAEVTRLRELLAVASTAEEKMAAAAQVVDGLEQTLKGALPIAGSVGSVNE